MGWSVSGVKSLICVKSDCVFAGLTAGECVLWSSMECSAAEEGDQRQQELRGSPRDFQLPDGFPHGGVGETRLYLHFHISRRAPPFFCTGFERLHTRKRSQRTRKCCQTCIPPTATLLHMNTHTHTVAHQKQKTHR